LYIYHILEKKKKILQEYLFRNYKLWSRKYPSAKLCVPQCPARAIHHDSRYIFRKFELL